VIPITLSWAWWCLGIYPQTGRDTTHSFLHNTRCQHPHSGATAATLHHSPTIDPESGTWTFLGLMPAIQRYKIHPQRAIIHEVTGLNGVRHWRSQNSMVDSSTTTTPILDLIAGDCWAGGQLCSGIKDVSVASKHMKSLTLVGVVFIDTLAIPELDRRSLHYRFSDPGSDCRRLFCATPATQWYKVRPCHIKAQEIADPCGGCLYWYPGDPRPRWQIAPRPLLRSRIRLREVVGLDTSYAMV